MDYSTAALEESVEKERQLKVKKAMYFLNVRFGCSLHQRVYSLKEFFLSVNTRMRMNGKIPATPQGQIPRVEMLSYCVYIMSVFAIINAAWSDADRQMNKELL